MMSNFAFEWRRLSATALHGAAQRDRYAAKTHLLGIRAP